MPTKTNVISLWIARGIEGNDRPFFKRYKNNPIMLQRFLNELNSRINSNKRAWVLMHVNSAHDHADARLDHHLNLGVLLVRNQVQGHQYWTDKIRQLEEKLALARHDEIHHPRTSQRFVLFGVKIYEKLTPAEKILKQIEYSRLQMEVAKGLGYNFLELLDDIHQKGELPPSYSKKSLVTSYFILESLMLRDGLSAMHLAAIYGDDFLLAESLRLLRRLDLQSDLMEQVVYLFTSRLRLFHDAELKLYFNATIGHCIAKNSLILQNSLFELLGLFTDLLAKGFPISVIRNILEIPVTDIAQENMKNFILKNYALLNQETKHILDGLLRTLYIDADIRRAYAMTPIGNPVAPPVAFVWSRELHVALVAEPSFVDVVAPQDDAPLVQSIVSGIDRFQFV